MLRSSLVLAAAAAFASVGTAGVASAEPGPPLCTYTLSPPHVVQVAGTNAVTATMSPAGCNQSIVYLSVACVQLQGSGGPGLCGQGQGILPAQVYYLPYQPGATYISTGMGCASTGNPPRPVCQPTGPYTTTL